MKIVIKSAFMVLFFIALANAQQVHLLIKQIFTSDAQQLKEGRLMRLTGLSSLINREVKEESNGMVTISKDGFLLFSIAYMAHLSPNLATTGGQGQDMALHGFEVINRSAGENCGELAGLLSGRGKKRRLIYLLDAMRTCPFRKPEEPDRANLCSIINCTITVRDISMRSLLLLT